nr:nuclear transport factor 2 family protein [Saccharomonospora saliphila]
MFEHIRNHDFEALRAIYHPDYVYAGPDGEQESGPDGVCASRRPIRQRFRTSISRFTPAMTAALERRLWK